MFGNNYQQLLSEPSQHLLVTLRGFAALCGKIDFEASIFEGRVRYSRL
jgi:hypothetical protein